MATLANLSIGLSADSKRLSKDLNRAKKKTKSWSNSMKKMARGVAGAMAGIAASLGTKAIIDNADALSKNSKALGLNIVAYQRLRFGLGQAGLSQSGFEKGIRKMNTAILDAGDGLKTSIDAFDKLGLSYEGLMKLSVEERFKAITSALEGVTDTGTRTAIAVKLLGREFGGVGVNTKQLIQDGKDIVVVTQSAARIAEVYKDAMSALTTTIFNLSTNGMAPFLEIMAEVMTGIRHLIVDFPTLTKWIGRVTVAVLALTVAMLANPIVRVVAAVIALGAALAVAYNKLKIIAKATGSISNAFILMGQAIRFEFDNIVAYGTLMGNSLISVAYSVRDVWTKVINYLTLKYAKLQDFSLPSDIDGGYEERARASNAKDLGRNQASRDALAASSARAEKTLSFKNPFLAHLKKILTPLEKVVDKIAVTIPTVRPPKGGKGGKAEEFDIFGNTNLAEPTSKAAESFAESFSSALSKAFKTGTFKGFLGSILDDFTSGIIDSVSQSLTKSLMSGLDVGSMISTVFSFLSFSDGGMVPSTPNSKSYADSVPAMLQPGELVVPKDQVDSFMGGGSGGGQVFNINVTGDVSRLTRKEIVGMMPEIAAGTNMLNRENNVRR
mgnify:CR=1 FL=1|tara:strand:- start:358 stop:2193 length:1836 start_codon:yes stop_codon:yes gene_type:complete